MNGAAIFLALLLAPAVPPPITAGALVAGLRGRAETADYRMTGRIVRVNADGTRRSYNVTVKARWFPGVLRILVNVTQPASARQRILLEMRPGGNSTILASPSRRCHTAIPALRAMDRGHSRFRLQLRGSAGAAVLLAGAETEGGDTAGRANLRGA